MIIIPKSHNNSWIIGVMELCFLNLLILIDCFLCNSTLVCFLKACHIWLTRNQMFIHEISEKFTSFIFWNFPFKHVVTSTNNIPKGKTYSHLLVGGKIVLSKDEDFKIVCTENNFEGYFNALVCLWHEGR